MFSKHQRMHHSKVLQTFLGTLLCVLIYFGYISRMIEKLRKFSFQLDDIVILHDVCMEPDAYGSNIVVYNSTTNETQYILVKAGPHVPGQKSNWTVHHSTIPRPTGKNYHFSEAAFFISTTCEGNFHHFWHDSTNGLFGAMKLTDALKSSGLSQLFYLSDVWKLDRRTGCHNPQRYQDILYALGIHKDHVYYGNSQPHSCYDKAVFGYYNKGFSIEEKYEYFKKAFDIKCPDPRKTRVTIIDRNVRKISNIKELQQASLLAGFDTRIVKLSEFSIAEQFRIIMCSDILVGIQGAGLRWIDFLPPKNSSLLELYWKHWGSFYYKQALSQGLKSAVLEAKHVGLNLKPYFYAVHNATPSITNKLVSQYELKNPVSEFDNHWKYADGIFDVTKFLSQLKLLDPKVHK